MQIIHTSYHCDFSKTVFSSIISTIYNHFLVCCIPTGTDVTSQCTSVPSVGCFSWHYAASTYKASSSYLYLAVYKVKGSWRAKTGKLLLSTYLNSKFGSCYCWWREQGTKKRSGAKSCCWDWMEISESKAGHAALQAHDVAVEGKQEISFVPSSLEI